ncbi:MAG: glycosyltransferase family 39 protein, partial [Singulisphaera sp.]
MLGLSRVTGLGLEPSGRLVSAVATALAAWGLYGLARRREGVAVALLAVAAFALFPLTCRYGRAFQPDAMMLAGVLVGLRCWDEYEVGSGRGWLVLGWLALATGLALKIVWASALIPLMAVVFRPRR